MIQLLDIKDKALAEQVLKLQQESYQIEAKIMDFYDLPPLKETIITLRESTETFFGWLEDKRIIAAISYKIEDNICDIHRLMVHPDYFRRGIARTLLKYVLEFAKETECIIVSTGTKNHPAKKLYLGLGFKEVDEIEVAPDVYITKFELNI